MIKTADWIIDLGPEGGERGGQLVACGTPEEIVRNPKSYTAQALKKIRSKKDGGMSRYSEKPLTFEGLKTVPIDARGGKVASSISRGLIKRAEASRAGSIRCRRFSPASRFEEWWRRCGGRGSRSARFSGAWAGTW